MALQHRLWGNIGTPLTAGNVLCDYLFCLLSLIANAFCVHMPQTPIACTASTETEVQGAANLSNGPAQPSWQRGEASPQNNECYDPDPHSYQR